MQPEDIKALINAQISCANLDVQFDGNHASLLIVSEAFDGLTSLKRQQLVYQTIADAIANGSLHAVNMKTYTPEEWASQ